MTRTALLALALLVSCAPQMETVCYWQCVGDGVEQSADTCEPTTKRNRDCDEPPKRSAQIGEPVQVIGFDPELSTDGHAVLVYVSAYVQSIVGSDFVLSQPGRLGMLGAGVWGDDGALIGLVQGEQGGTGLMWGREVE